MAPDEPGSAPQAEIYTRRLGPFPSVSPPVFLASVAVIALLIAYGTIFTQTAEGTFSGIQAWIANTFGWFYVASATFFLGFVIWLMFSRYGNVRLGDRFERPRFGLLGWFAMLFSAGMGIGLLYWSVAEPMYHYLNPPTGGEGSAREAVRYTFYHWGLHPWAIYSVTGLSIGYFAYRQKLPLTIRSAFYPLLGDRIYGPLGHLVDTLAVLGTMFGVATSLGLGVLQISAGLEYLIGLPQSPAVQVGLIAGITAIATISVLLGLSRGIQRLSTFNIVLSIVLLIFLLLVGPTIFILRFFVESTGDYLQNLVAMSLWTDSIAQSGWQADWTIFYWGWWISWAPFVGMFIARVSRGRTIRQFVLGVLFAPTLATFAWLSVFGGNAVYMEVFENSGVAQAVEQNLDTALFVTLSQLPLSAITATLTVLIIVTYFVTSSDSGSLVIDMLTAGGHADPPKSQRLFWATTEGVVAAVLLLAGGLSALQAASITAGLPFCIVMLFMCWSLVKGLASEPVTPTRRQKEPKAPEDTMGDIEHEDEAGEGVRAAAR